MDLTEKYYTSALHFLARRPRSEKELRDNLKKKKASDEVIVAIVHKLKEQHFLDDLAFSKWWIEQRTKFRAKSRRLITMELRQKGVDEDSIKTAFAGEFEESIDDLTKAKRIVEQKLSRVRLLSRDEQRQKLSGFLARRGFDWDVIRRAIDDIL